MEKSYETWGDGVPPIGSVGRTAAADAPAPVEKDARALERATAWEMALAIAAMMLAAVVILAHAGLILGGGWGGDEYSNFARFRELGLEWYFSRTFGWSPRPLSDGVLFLYSLAVNHWRMALITPFLGLLWAILIGGTVSAAWQRGAPGLLSRLALACGVLAVFLIGHNVNDLFYWPMGAAAYLLDLTGIAVVTFQIIYGGAARRSGRVACAAGLIIAATSSEVGLFFALTFTAAMLILEGPGWASDRDAGLRAWRWLLVPLAIALSELACLVYVVVTNPWRGINQTSIYFHHFLRSLLATLQTSGHEVFMGDPSPAGISTAAWLLVLGMLFVGSLGAYFRRPDSGPSWGRLLALSAGLLGCYYLTLLASYYEYGEAYNEPQASVRKCLIPLGVVAAAWIVGKCLSADRQRLRVLGPAALLGAACLAGVARLPALTADYALLPEIRQARDMTWQSAKGPGDPLLFVVPPRGSLLTGEIPAVPGHFVLGAAGVQWWQNGIMSFFHKKSLRFTSFPAK